MIKSIISAALVALSINVQAEVLPTPQPYDKRITLAKYNPQDVIKVRTMPGRVTLIQLEKGERSHSQVGIGDDKAWGMGTIENNIFLKPIKRNPNTNLIIVTNKGRTYTFKLVTSKYPHYIVKMDYEKKKVADDYAPKMPCSDGELNFNYQKWGDDVLSPTYMWDDGRFTCLKFAAVSELPVVYQIASDGQEALANYHVKEDTMIVHSIASEYRLRLGNSVLGLKSDSVKPSGFNKKGTSLNGVKREITNE